MYSNWNVEQQIYDLNNINALLDNCKVVEYVSKWEKDKRVYAPNALQLSHYYEELDVYELLWLTDAID